MSTRAFPRAGITFVSALRTALRYASLNISAIRRYTPIQVIPSCEGGPARWQTRLVGVALDEEARDGCELRLVFRVRGHLALLLLRFFKLGHVSVRQVRRLSLEEAGAERRLAGCVADAEAKTRLWQR